MKDLLMKAIALPVTERYRLAFLIAESLGYELTRFINCEVCQTEGRILTSNGGPDEIDNGICPACNGDCVVQVNTLPIEPEDMEDAYGTADL